MGAHLADGIDPALIVVHARILALLTQARQRVGTVGVDGALRLALHVGVALQPEGAAALTGAARGARHRVPPARVRLAGVHNVGLDGRRPHALHQRVAGVAGQAGAHRRVDAHVALGVAAAHAGAGVVTAVVAAGPVGGTVGIDDTLRLALHIGVALVLGRTGAHAIVAHAAWRQGTTSAGVGTARVCHHRFG